MVLRMMDDMGMLFAPASFTRRRRSGRLLQYGPQCIHLDPVHAAQHNSILTLRYLLKTPTIHIDAKRRAIYGALSAGKYEAVKVCEEEGYPFDSTVAEKPLAEYSDPLARMSALFDESVSYDGRWRCMEFGDWPVESLDWMVGQQGGKVILRNLGSGYGVMSTAVKSGVDESVVLHKVRYIATCILDRTDRPGAFDSNTFRIQASRALRSAIEKNMGKVVVFLICDCRARLTVRV